MRTMNQIRIIALAAAAGGVAAYYFDPVNGAERRGRAASVLVGIDKDPTGVPPSVDGPDRSDVASEAAERGPDSTGVLVTSKPHDGMDPDPVGRVASATPAPG